MIWLWHSYLLQGEFQVQNLSAVNRLINVWFKIWYSYTAWHLFLQYIVLASDIISAYLDHIKPIANCCSSVETGSIDNSPAGNYMFKVNSRNTRTRCEVCSKLTIKTPEWRKWRCSGVFIVNFEHISHLVQVLL